MTKKHRESLEPLDLAGWTAWLDRRVEETSNVYLADPDRLLSDSRKERETSKDYSGRELLELIQNARDAAVEARTPGRVRIEVSKDGLVVANVGRPFSPAGLKSLMLANLSPKRRNQNLVGSKGLGFRAILNWTAEPIVASGPLLCAFSHATCVAHLEDLAGQNLTLAEAIDSEKARTGHLPVSLLAFPAYGPRDQVVPNLSKVARRVLSTCERLRGEGFDTAIGIPFLTRECEAECRSQVEKLGIELLLVLPDIERIEFRIDDDELRTYRCKRRGEKHELLSSDSTSTTWHVVRREGTVTTSGEAERYELLVAVPHHERDVESTPLYSYFPTEIALPLPCVCHATLDLEQNRKQPRDTPINREILSKLAQLLPQVAEEFSNLKPDDPWAALSLIRPKVAYPAFLQRVEFEKALISEARLHRIVPTISGQRLKASKAKRVPGASPDWLPAKRFSMVAWARSWQERHFLLQLQIEELPVDEFQRRLAVRSALSIDARARLIAKLATNFELHKYCSASLLLDQDGDPVLDVDEVVLAPADRSDFQIPEWAKLRFLNDDLRDALAAAFNARDARSLQSAMTAFGLKEYSLLSIVSSLFSAHERRLEEGRDQRQAELELRRALFAVYQQASRGSLPAFPSHLKVKLPNRSKELVDADSLYLSAEFGGVATISEELYAPWAPEKLVGTLSAIGIRGPQDEVGRFLHWLGVGVWPRLQNSRPPAGGKEFLNFALGQLQYPAKFGDKVYPDSASIPRPALSSVTTLDGLPEILNHANPYAVATWLASDPRHALFEARSRLRYDPLLEYEGHARIGCHPWGARNRRNYEGPTPSYIAWFLRNTAWVPTAVGDLRCPQECIVDQKELPGLYFRPKAPSEADLRSLAGVASPSLIRDGWRVAGALGSLADLSNDDVYELLLAVPHKDASGEAARQIYRWLLHNEEGDYGGDCESKRTFLRSGRMYGQKDGARGYFPIGELRHVDGGGFPQELLRKVALADLPGKVGIKKVERLFGVAALDRSKLAQEVNKVAAAEGADEASRSFELAKPYLRLLRQLTAAQSEASAKLGRLKLTVCRQLIVTFTYEGETYEEALNPWSGVIDEDRLLVTCDLSKRLSECQTLLWEATGEAIASMLGLREGGDFARLLACDHGSREQLLIRMRGEILPEDLERLRLEQVEVQDDFQLKSSIDTQRGPIPPPPVETIPVDSPNAAKTEDTIRRPAAEPSELSFQVEEKVRSPITADKARITTVRKVKATRRTSAHKNVTDPDLCEKLAFQFEELAHPPRFPRLVSHVMGELGFGCDVLSFETEAARDQFEQDRSQTKLISRFIEVKGRSSRSAVLLAGNELDCAKLQKDRFFLYRFFQDGDSFELSVLKNPLGAGRAVSEAFEIAMDRADGTELFELKLSARDRTEETADS